MVLPLSESSSRFQTTEDSVCFKNFGFFLNSVACILMVQRQRWVSQELLHWCSVDPGAS